MAQGPPQQQSVMPESSWSAQQLPHRRPSHTSSKGGHGELSSDSPQAAADGRAIPGINILLVAVEHLSQWLPRATLVSTPDDVLPPFSLPWALSIATCATLVFTQTCFLAACLTYASHMHQCFICFV